MPRQFYYVFWKIKGFTCIYVLFTLRHQLNFGKRDIYDTMSLSIHQKRVQNLLSENLVSTSTWSKVGSLVMRVACSHHLGTYSTGFHWRVESDLWILMTCLQGRKARESASRQKHDSGFYYVYSSLVWRVVRALWKKNHLCGTHIDCDSSFCKEVLYYHDLWTTN